MPDYTALLVTAALTALGWYATYAYAKMREDRTRRLDLRLRHRVRQLDELYGPLLSLVEHIFNVWRVRQSILQSRPDADEVTRRITEFFWTHYFRPLHEEISGLLQTKLYLLEDGRLPRSFSEYLKHATQETCQHQLASELGIDTSDVRGSPWPKAFHADVKSAVERLMHDYKAELESLAPSRIPVRASALESLAR